MGSAGYQYNPSAGRVRQLDAAAGAVVVPPGTLFGQLLTTQGPPGSPTSLPLQAEWISPTNNPTWTQATWFIDPANSTGVASDQNSGIDALHPVLTYQGGIVAKWGTDSPTLAQNTVFTWLSSQPIGISDPVIFKPTIKGGAQVTLQGLLTAAQQLHAGLLGAVVSKNRATPQLLTADLGFAAPIGSLVKNTQAGKVSYAFVYKHVAGTVFALTQPLAPAVLPVTSGLPPTEIDTYAPGDSFVLYAPTQVRVIQLLPLMTSAAAEESPAPVSIYHMTVSTLDGALGSSSVYIGNDTSIVEAGFESQISDDSGSDGVAGLYWNAFAGAGVFAANEAAFLTAFWGGAIVQQFAQGISSWLFDFDAIIDATAGGTGFFLGSLPVTESHGLLYIAGLVSAQRSVGFSSTSSFSGTPILWGPGTFDAQGSSRVWFDGLAVPKFINVGGLLLNSQTFANPFNRATGVWSPSLIVTPANIDAAVGVAGFGGTATNIGGATFTNQGEP